MKDLMTNQDISIEHDICHTSDDWSALKDRCVLCYQASKSITGFIGGDWRDMLGTSIHAWKNEDRTLSPNLLEL